MSRFLAILGALLISTSVHEINSRSWWLMIAGTLFSLEAIAIYISTCVKDESEALRVKMQRSE